MKIFASGSANSRINKKYSEGFDKIAEYLSKNNHSIVIVGSKFGTVGSLYNEMIKNNGEVNTITPLCYKEDATGMKTNNSILTDSLFTLQKLFLSNSDVTLVLPGGNGTLAELFMLTDLIKSKYTTNPVIIYNVNDFYTPIKNYLNFLIEVGALEKFQHDYFRFCNTSDEVIKELENYSKKIK